MREATGGFMILCTICGVRLSEDGEDYEWHECVCCGHYVCADCVSPFDEEITCRDCGSEESEDE